MEKQIRKDYIQSIKDKDQMKKTTLSLLLNEINSKKKETGISEQDSMESGEIIKILTKEIKKRNQSIEQFTIAKRIELVVKEEQELSILQTYMPEPLTEDQLRNLIMTTKEMNPGIIEGKLIGLVNKSVAGLNPVDQIKKLIKEVNEQYSN